MKKFFRSLFSVNPSSLTLCNIVLVIILFLIGLPILDLIELKTYDLRFKSRDTLKPSPSVVMAVIDEKSLDREGRWPWPRSKLAHLVDILSRDGAKVIGFDIGFPEPDENSYLKFIAHLDHRIEALGIRDKQLADFLSESKAEADNDVLFADAVRRSNASVVLGYFFHMTEADLNYRIDQEEKNRQLERIDHSKYPLILYEDQGMEIPPFISTYAPEANLAVLVGATKLSGYFNMLPDKDGAAR